MSKPLTGIHLENVFRRGLDRARSSTIPECSAVVVPLIYSSKASISTFFFTNFVNFPLNVVARTCASSMK